MTVPDLEALYRQALVRAHPSRCLPRVLSREGQLLRVGPHSAPAQDVRLLAIGKAAAAMTEAAEALLGDCITDGLLVTKQPMSHPRFEVCIGGHPLPDSGSLAAGGRVWDFAQQTPASATVLVLLSGGASALVELPRAGHSWAEVLALYRELLRSGLPIEEINRRRSLLSLLKGGGLGRKLPPQNFTLVLSDVVDSPLEVVGSGLTAGQPMVLVADGKSMLQDLPAIVFCDHLRGEAREVGRLMAAVQAPGLYAAVGETTVTVTGSGRGGRCQELALSFALAAQGRRVELLAAGSDGEDGSSDVAGARVDGGSVARARALGLDPEALLANHDSYAFFSALGEHVRTGPTGTNVNDLVLFRID